MKSNFDDKDWINKRKSYKNKNTVEYLFEKIQKSDRNSLAAAITLIESELLSDKQMASLLIEKCLPLSGNAIRIGVTGVPGVGKSTFIETFGLKLINEGKKVAVLSIDPSSETTNGSILGDKTRMENLSKQEHAYIRPSSTRSHLGGVAKFTKESIILCEAAGYDVILIETVGVGQSETLVHSMVDFFLLLMLPGAGDELQGIKRGIMEMADAIVVTKAEDEQRMWAKKTALFYTQAIHYFPMNENGWNTKVLLYSCFDNKSLNIIRDTIFLYFQTVNIEHKRLKQEKYWMNEYLKQLIMRDIQSLNIDDLNEVQNKLEHKELNAFEAASILYQKLKNKNGENRF